jgi:AraC-like DNA-binding protein
MRTTDDLNLTKLSYENGFADQSHFIKEFRLLTGINPRGFLKRQGDFIVNPADH